MKKLSKFTTSSHLLAYGIFGFTAWLIGSFVGNYYPNTLVVFEMVGYLGFVTVLAGLTINAINTRW